jgi:hypothetical protein
MTEARMQSMLAKGIPPGATRAQVEAWARSNGFTNIRYESWPMSRVHHPTDETWISMRTDQMKEAGLNPNNVRGVLDITVLWAYVNVFMDGHLYVDFFFDGAGRLIKYQVKVFVLAP